MLDEHYMVDDVYEPGVSIGFGEDLALKTGFASQMAGPNGSASYGQLVTLAIPIGAAPEAQMDWNRYYAPCCHAHETPVAGYLR